jgi:hypothetical protein
MFPSFSSWLFPFCGRFGVLKHGTLANLKRPTVHVATLFADNGAACCFGIAFGCCFGIAFGCCFGPLSTTACPCQMPMYPTLSLRAPTDHCTAVLNGPSRHPYRSIATSSPVHHNILTGPSQHPPQSLMGWIHQLCCRCAWEVPARDSGEQGSRPPRGLCAAVTRPRTASHVRDKCSRSRRAPVVYVARLPWGVLTHMVVDSARLPCGCCTLSMESLVWCGVNSSAFWGVRRSLVRTDLVP